MADIQFVIGKLIENEIGAFYEGIVFDRWLKVELMDGRVIAIFDYQLVFDGLIIGESYEFVILPLSLAQKNLRSALDERGAILDIQEILEWQPIEPFIVIHSDLIGKTLKIAKTSLGGIVLGRGAQREIYLDTDNQHKLIALRFDLLGVRAIE